MKIYFKADRNQPQVTKKIYPERKSSLELVIDEWLYKNSLETSLSEISRNATIIHKTKRNTYPGVYRWRQTPPLSLDWKGSSTAWQVPHVEAFRLTENTEQITLHTFDSDSATKAIDSLRLQMLGSVKKAYSAKSFVTFTVQTVGLSDQKRESIAQILHRC